MLRTGACSQQLSRPVAAFEVYGRPVWLQQTGLPPGLSSSAVQLNEPWRDHGTHGVVLRIRGVRVREASRTSSLRRTLARTGSHFLAEETELSLQILHIVRFPSFRNRGTLRIVLVGRVVSSTTFDPKQAFIVQNKAGAQRADETLSFASGHVEDELSIGLELSTIPTARDSRARASRVRTSLPCSGELTPFFCASFPSEEFRDAIESLSPEQQRFAKAIRSMQLESTLFGLVIVHIKPQLEKAAM